MAKTLKKRLTDLERARALSNKRRQRVLQLEGRAYKLERELTDARNVLLRQAEMAREVQKLTRSFNILSNMLYARGRFTEPVVSPNNDKMYTTADSLAEHVVDSEANFAGMEGLGDAPFFRYRPVNNG